MLMARDGRAEKTAMECHMELSRELAKDFDKAAIDQIAAHARLCADLMIKHGPSPWKMAQGERDALDTFRQLAAYARRLSDML